MAVPDARRSIPQVDRLLRALGDEIGDLPRTVATDAVRTVVEGIRRRARRSAELPGEAEIFAMARAELETRRKRLLRPVVNATGVVLHTNLGRAPLSPRALDAVVRVASGYSNLEWDIDSGRRGDRYVHVEPLIAVATGAQAALVVNNNAAAILLVCAALAAGREVVISRGELIEIGGEFRIPEVLAQSGAVLREVGTTNRTHLRDYERALGDDTAMILKVHPSNYRVVGFTRAPTAPELAQLAKARKVPFVYDVGSGLLHRPLADEPVVTDALASGADLVCFSGDKLLGGPQAGIICGRAKLVDQLRKHPLLRALRPDKMQLAALAETVITHLEAAVDDIPIWRMIDTPYEDLERRAKSLGRRLRSTELEVDIVTAGSVTGGGSLPGHGIDTPVLRLRHPRIGAKALASALRSWDPPVAVRVEKGYVVCDLRTVLPEQDGDVAGALRSF